MTSRREPPEIHGVPTSIAAFLGEAERGPTTPQLVTSVREYQQLFGGASGPDRYLPDAVAGFFVNGGQRLYVARIVPKGGEQGGVPDAADFAGGEADDPVQGLRALDAPEYSDVSLVYAPHPPAHSADIARTIIEHCERHRFRFAIVDCDKTVDLNALAVPERWRSSHAALYAPWIAVADPAAAVFRVVPAGGAVAGIYARTDLERGVFNAPANQEVRGAVGMHVAINDLQQDALNDRGINVIRQFPNRGILVWGARSLASDPEWKYVSVRRYFIFLERSIVEGASWVVFEPNDDRLWNRVKDTIRLFLRSEWRRGGLQGRTEDEAFFVKCDRTTMTEDDILNGRLNIEVGFAPLKPAEFVVIRIGLWTAEAAAY
jgi:uncharacterized protein